MQKNDKQTNIGITTFSGETRIGLGNRLVAIFNAPESFLAEHPKASPQWELGYYDVKGQIESLTLYQQNPNKPDLPDGHFEKQMNHYQSAISALEAKM